MKILFPLLLACLAPLAGVGQSRKAPAAVPAKTFAAPVFASPAGVYAVVSHVALSPAHPGPNGVVGMQLLRAPAGSTNYKEVARVQQAATLAEFRKQTGTALSQIQNENQLASEEAAWAFVQAHPDLDDYGLLGISMPFRVAMGTAALDAEAATAPAGTRFSYRLVPEYAAGRAPSQPAPPIEGSVATGQRSPLARPRLLRAVGYDSAVAVRWTAPARPDPATGLTTLFGRVWRRGPGERSYSVAAGQLLANRTERGDSVWFQLRQAVRPEALYRYYIEPLDFVSNPGPASDTATVVSVDVRKLPLVSRVSARDTAEGIALRWPVLPPKAYLLGIEIQRSRDVRGNYVRLDTVPASASGYLDSRLLPDLTYYYRLRVLLRAGLKAPEITSGAAFAAHRSGAGRTAPPLAPVQVSGVPEGRGVRLHWQPAAPDLSLSGYYVYRATSLDDSLVVVSPYLPAAQTSYLDTTARNGRRQYVYAVRAADKSLQPSSFSARVAAQPNRPMTVAAPLGVSGFADGPVLRLRWDDAQRRDPDVVAYRLYRRAVAPAGRAASTGKSDYIVLADNLPGPAYDDRSARMGSAYEYAATALDALGNESPLSPAMVLQLGSGTPAAPAAPRLLNARAVPSGVELSWSHPVAAPAQGYALYRRTREQATLQRLATVPAQTRFVDQTAKPGTLYIYSLAALGAVQESARTPEISARR